MTVIAYDGRYVAADKMANSNGLARTVKKLFVMGRRVVSFSGDTSHGNALLAWYSAGANPETLPKPSHPDRDAYLHVFEKGKHVLQYETGAFPNVFTDPTFASGCGRDYALAAMHCGKSAREAAEIACHFEVNCGMGIDVVDLWEIAREHVEAGGCAPAVAVG